MTEVTNQDNLTDLKMLFASNQYDTVMMYTVLYGHTGSAMVDSLECPTVARLDTGAFTIFGGNPESTAARELIAAKPISFVTPENTSWEKALYETGYSGFTKFPFTQWNAYNLNCKTLKSLADTLPTGYSRQRLNTKLCEQLPAALDNEYFFENFKNIDDFLQRGIGYCIVFDGVIVAAATSMAAAADMIDIEIETAPNYQNKGLGTAVAANLILDCLRHDINPKWLAANEKSSRLAKKLGFTQGESYYTLGLVDDE